LREERFPLPCRMFRAIAIPSLQNFSKVDCPGNPQSGARILVRYSINRRLLFSRRLRNAIIRSRKSHRKIRCRNEGIDHLANAR
jgi:hypothetical protein